MEEYACERARRVAQFCGWLKATAGRALAGKQGDWFLRFSESAGEESGVRKLGERRKIAAPRAAAAAPAGGRPAGGLAAGFAEIDLPDEGWREDDSGERFVQFAFAGSLFFLDLPLTTLSRDEAQRILAERPGFRYMRDWKQFPMYSPKAARAWNPLDKLYQCGDEEAAAADAGYLFFDLWKFPADWKFFVTACSFAANARLAKDAPLE